jgi:hypothetical protein
VIDVRTYATKPGGVGSAGRAGKFYRGSRRRLKRITLRGNWSIELLLFVAWVLFALLVLVPWLVRHPQEHERPTADPPIIRPLR